MAVGKEGGGGEVEVEVEEVEVTAVEVVGVVAVWMGMGVEEVVEAGALQSAQSEHPPRPNRIRIAP